MLRVISSVVRRSTSLSAYHFHETLARRSTSVSSSGTSSRVHATPQQSGKIICRNLIHLMACATHGQSSERNGKAHFHPVNSLKAPSSDWDLCCPCRDHVVGFRPNPGTSIRPFQTPRVPCMEIETSPQGCHWRDKLGFPT